MIKKYVLGFLFNDEKTKICLIQKNRPDWQRGKLNGVGGKIGDMRKSELPDDAMIREFREETGVSTQHHDWKLFTILDANDLSWKCYCFYCFNSEYLNSVKTMTDEQIIIKNIDSVSESEFVDTKILSIIKKNIF
jgi:8-oxo-dGTP diphosphatase